MKTRLINRVGRIGVLGLLAAALAFSWVSPNSASWAADGPTVSRDEPPKDVPEDEIPPVTTDPLEAEVPGGDTATPNDAITPAYYLFKIYTGMAGPCQRPDTVGRYEGEYYVPRYHYNTPVGKVYYYMRTFKRSYSIGQYKYFEYQDRGFTTAHRYLGCDTAPVRRYYGAQKASRIKTLVRFCRDTCNAGVWQYQPWKKGGW